MSTAIRRAIYGKLAGDTTLNGLLSTEIPTGYPASKKNIWHDIAPDDPGYPLVVFSKNSGTPLYTYKTPTSMGTAETPTPTSHAFVDNEIWMVKGVDHNVDTDKVDAIATRIDTLLTDWGGGAPPTLGTAGTLLYMRRESDLEFAENDGGEIYRHAGGLYRLYYSLTP